MVVIYASSICGWVGGWFLRILCCESVDVVRTDVQKYMKQVVNAEEALERHNLLRKSLHDANRRTMPRVNAGPSARVTKMRRRRTDNPAGGRDNV